jgi:uncharacterized protein (DUF697 family)
MLCREKAREWVHMFAAGGAAWSTIPVPMSTTAGLVAAETQMIYVIGRIYGERLDGTDMAVAAGGLGLAGMGLKVVAIEACNFVPVAGWAVKGVIAASAIEGIGAVIIRHYEHKYPGKTYTERAGIDGLPAKSWWQWRPWKR